MHDMLEPRTFHVRMHNENVLHAMPLPVHTMDQCEYNLLNRQAAPVQHIEPRNEQQPKEERFWREEQYQPEHGDRHDDKRREDYDRDRNDKGRDNYN